MSPAPRAVLLGSSNLPYAPISPSPSALAISEDGQYAMVARGELHLLVRSSPPLPMLCRLNGLVLTICTITDTNIGLLSGSLGCVSLGARERDLVDSPSDSWDERRAGRRWREGQRTGAGRRRVELVQDGNLGREEERRQVVRLGRWCALLLATVPLRLIALHDAQSTTSTCPVWSSRSGEQPPGPLPAFRNLAGAFERSFVALLSYITASNTSPCLCAQMHACDDHHER